LSRLDDVLERHQRRTRQTRERITWIAIVVGLFVVVMVLLIFTDLGKPPLPAGTAAPAAASGSSQPPPPRSSVDGVLLGAPRPARATKPTRP